MIETLSAAYSAAAAWRREWYARDPSRRRTLTRPVVSVGNLRVGGSLEDYGGHNILEPAIFGKPIVFGPHMQNFKEIADAFLSNDAAIQVQTERELNTALLALVTDPVRRARLGAAARALVEANRGAKAKTLQVIAELLPYGDDGHGRSIVRPFRLVH